jgi:hypothetical protein
LPPRPGGQALCHIIARAATARRLTCANGRGASDSSATASWHHRSSGNQHGAESIKRKSNAIANPPSGLCAFTATPVRGNLIPGSDFRSDCRQIIAFDDFSPTDAGRIETYWEKDRGNTQSLALRSRDLLDLGNQTT